MLALCKPRKNIVVSAALNGILTDPKVFNIPVTAKEIGQAARDCYNAGATIAHVHFRDQREGKGHLPTWDPAVAADVAHEIRERVPEMLVNFTTGTLEVPGPMGGGDLGSVKGPLSCIVAGKPDIAALNSGSLNYLRLKRDNTWAWPPIAFENSVEKITAMLEGMRENGAVPECECFDTGIVRSISMFESNGLLQKPYYVSLAMGVARGLPCKPEWVDLLVKELQPNTNWQVIAVGGAEQVWPTLRRAAELGGNVRTGLEDTFYLPDGEKTESNGALIEALVGVCKDVGREPSTAEETRTILGLR
jgi:3-keto-5-aminohexanoate cleavage enzyme